MVVLVMPMDCQSLCLTQVKEWPVEPTRERGYQRRIAELERQVAQLVEQVAKLCKNSSNSSKLPSSDIVKPPKPKPKGKNKKRRRKTITQGCATFASLTSLHPELT